MKLNKLKPCLFLIVTIILTAACGTSIKRTLSVPDEHERTVVIQDGRMEVYPDDHQGTRKNACRIFDTWAKDAHLSRNITGRRLMALSPKEDGCHLTFDFRLMDGTQRRVTLVVKDYTQTYRNTAKDRRSAIVNGRKYEFRN
ncbi:MAG: hypothetical protein IJ584_07745 [Bacteroidales bacterium]|nr:hypothetical protein [Bacteroidales bacterium]